MSKAWNLEILLGGIGKNAAELELREWWEERLENILGPYEGEPTLEYILKIRVFYITTVSSHLRKNFLTKFHNV